jgi:hypothetical protein
MMVAVERIQKSFARKCATHIVSISFGQKGFGKG